MNAYVREPTLAEVEVEQTVLALLLQGSETAWMVLDRIAAQDMLEPVHGRVVDAVRRVLDAGKEPNPLSVAAAMASDASLNTLGGAEYLRTLASRHGKNRDIAPELCDALIDQGQKRALAREIAETEARLKDASLSASEIIAEHEAAVRALAEGRAAPDEPSGWYEIGAAALEVDPSKAALLPYGIPELDDAIGGMAPGDVVILAGRPGMGKSAVALHIAHYAAREKKQLSLELTGDETCTAGVGVFLSSLEMTKPEIIGRGLSMRAYAKGGKVPYKHIRLRKLTPKDEDIIVQVLREDSNLPLIVDDKGSQSVAQIGVRMRRTLAKLARDGKKLGLGIIDHLQLIEGDGRHDGNRVAELTRITKALKVLAKSLGIPLLVLCQLSREVEKREDKKPQISDLRESGSIEQDADVVILIHRPEYYLANSEPAQGTKEMAEWDAAMNKARGKLHLAVPKNRHGAPASVTVNCSIAHNWIGTL